MKTVVKRGSNFCWSSALPYIYYMLFRFSIIYAMLSLFHPYTAFIYISTYIVIWMLEAIQGQYAR
jgi:hypothetical protein